MKNRFSELKKSRIEVSLNVGAQPGKKSHLDNSILDSEIKVRNSGPKIPRIKRESNKENKLPPLFTLAKERKRNPGACIRAK